MFALLIFLLAVDGDEGKDDDKVRTADKKTIWAPKKCNFFSPTNTPDNQQVKYPENY